MLRRLLLVEFWMKRLIRTGKRRTASGMDYSRGCSMTGSSGGQRATLYGCQDALPGLEMSGGARTGGVH